MKKSIKVVIAVALMVILALSLMACTGKRRVEFQQENLMKKAAVISSSNYVKNAKYSKDGKAGTSAKLTKPIRSYIDFDLGAILEFNTMILNEKTDAVDCFRIFVKENQQDEWTMIYQQDRITNYRLCYLEGQKARYIRMDLVEVRGKVELSEIELYNMPKTQRGDFRVTQYLVMMDKDEKGNMTFSMKDMLDNEGFAGNYNIVTDVMIINGIGLDANADMKFGAFTEQEFANNLADLRKIIANNSVKIRVTIFINPYKSHTENAKFLKDNADKISTTLKAFVDKYKIDGIDYDWEYPENGSQWNVYSQLIVNTAKFTEVSVALPNWGIGLTKQAIEAIKFVNLMTYDIFDERGNHSNIYLGGVAAINQLLDKGFSKSQICLGIPTYARTVDKSNSAWPSLVNYPELGKWGNIVKDFAYKDKVNGVEVNLVNTAYFNGYAMTRDKTALALAMDIGGVMLFRARCDAPYTYEFSCHRAVEDVMKNYN